MRDVPNRGNVEWHVTTSLTISACAKINLCLGVGPPEPPGALKPGFHPIASWFVGIDLCDEIELRRATTGPGSCRVEWADDAPKPAPIDWAIEKDLGVRAHRLLERAAGRALPVEMVVRKRIPVGGGLGGGSSDAAGVLVGITRLFDLPIDAAGLRRLSGELGSDIAFFIDELPAAEAGSTLITLAPRPALVTGFGEVLERLEPVAPAPRTSVLLFVPDFGCPTGAVYRAFDARPHAPLDAERVQSLIAGAQSRSGRGIASGELFNHLAAPACDVQPELAAVLSALREAMGPKIPVHVTGSGSTMFAIAGPDSPTRVRDVPVRVVACRTI